MTYLVKHTQAYFESRVLDGPKIWKELRDDMTIVLAHPNGWTIREKNFLRKAAIAAKYTTEDKAHAQIHFVSEAEASMHFCMFHSDIHRGLEPGTSLVVCDAGGSTIDTTAYRVKNTSPVLELEEVKASACVQAGGVFVDLECEKHLKGILDKIELGQEERNDYIQNGVNDFETFTKRSFGLKGPDDALPETVRGFFDRCVAETAGCIRQQMSGFNPKHVLLVGGFGDSSHLFNSVGCSVTIANDSTSKAVADGSVIWSAKLSVVKRATRTPYGTNISTHYNPQSPEHADRTVVRWANGMDCVERYWSQIVGKGVVIDAAETIRRPYRRVYKNPNPCLDRFALRLLSWTNDGELPNEWMCDKHGKYKLLPLGLGGALEKKSGPDGDYYELNHNVAFQFGGTELTAFIEWEQDGKTHTGPASVLPSALVIV
ncbi:hypothetical protein FRC09_013662 [Ceratobasidium sp. 395]|nr:hypothetical protein FRC09_013662 [Ceratobasidium sp. 395]